MGYRRTSKTRNGVRTTTTRNYGKKGGTTVSRSIKSGITRNTISTNLRTGEKTQYITTTFNGVVERRKMPSLFNVKPIKIQKVKKGPRRKGKASSMSFKQLLWCFFILYIISILAK